MVCVTEPGRAAAYADCFSSRKIEARLSTQDCRERAPDLPLRHELIALADDADADAQRRSRIAEGGRIDRRTAFRAEGLHALVSAFGGLDVDRRLAGEQAELVRRASKTEAR